MKLIIINTNNAENYCFMHQNFPALGVWDVRLEDCCEDDEKRAQGKGFFQLVLLEENCCLADQGTSGQLGQ